MRKYKVGDKVVIHSLEYLQSIATLKSYGDVLCMPNGNAVVHEMYKFCGKVLTISKRLHYSDKSYGVEESDKIWTEDMIKSLSYSIGEIYE